MRMSLKPGDPVRVEMTKWVDAPHWHMPAIYLGSDSAGDWIVATYLRKSRAPGRP